MLGRGHRHRACRKPEDIKLPSNEERPLITQRNQLLEPPEFKTNTLALPLEDVCDLGKPCGLLEQHRKGHDQIRVWRVR